MWELFLKGGIIMWPILAGSIAAVGLILERLWVLQRWRVAPADFYRRVEALTVENKISEARAACGENNSSLAQILGVALENLGRPDDKFREAVEMAGRGEISLLERHIGLIGTIAAIEPLLGLLGTVIGLIAAFRNVEATGVIGDPRVVAGGVWEALITTAGGLIVAIPVVLVHRYLRSRVDRLILEIEERVYYLVDMLQRRQTTGSDAGRSAP